MTAAWIQTMDGAYLNAAHVELIAARPTGFSVTVPDEAGAEGPKLPCYELVAYTPTGGSKVLGLRLGDDNAAAGLRRLAERLIAGGEVAVRTSPELREVYASEADPF